MVMIRENKKVKAFTAAVLAVTLLFASIQTSVFAKPESPYKNYLDGWHVSATWENNESEYVWNAAEDERKQPVLSMSYRIDQAEEEYPVGSISFTVPGIGQIGRDKTIEADDFTDHTLDFWKLTWDKEKDSYTFTNRFRVSEGESVSGEFKLKWALEARDCRNGFEMEESPVFSLKENDSIELPPVVFSFASEPDQYNIFLNKETEEEQDGFAWYSFATDFIPQKGVRSLEAADYEIKIDPSEDMIWDDIRVLQNGKEVDIQNDENGGICFSLFAINEKELEDVPEEKRSFELGLRTEAFDGQQLEITPVLKGRYQDEEEYVDIDPDRTYSFSVESYGAANDNSRLSLRMNNPYTDGSKKEERLNSLDLYSGKVIPFTVYAGMGNSKDKTADKVTDQNTQLPDGIYDWEDVRWNEDGLYDVDTSEIESGSTYEDMYPSSGERVASDSDADPGDRYIPDINIFGKLFSFFTDMENKLTMTSYAAEKATDSNAEKEKSDTDASSEEKEYSVILGDDKIGIYLNNGTIRDLEDDEYDIAYMSIPETKESYGYEIYGATSKDTAVEDYLFLQAGETWDTDIAYFRPGIKAVFIRINGVEKDFSVKADIGVRFHIDLKSEQEKEPDKQIDFSNRLVNFIYSRLLHMDEEGFEISDDEPDEDAYKTEYAQDTAEKDVETYGERVNRCISNVWLRPSETEVAVQIKDAADETEQTSVTSITGQIQSEDNQPVTEFSLYVKLPEGVSLNTEDVSINGSAMTWEGEEFSNFEPYADISIEEENQLVIHFDLAEEPLRSDAGIQIEVLLYNKEETETDEWNGLSADLIVHHLTGKITGKDISVSPLYADQNAEEREVSAHARSAELNEKTVNGYHECAYGQVKSSYSSLYTNTTVTRLYAADEPEELQEKSLYSYRLKFGTTTDDTKSIVLYDHIEQGASLTEKGKLADHTEWKKGSWNGKLILVDTAAIEKLGATATVFYSDAPDQEEDLGAEGWSETPSENAKSIAVQIEIPEEMDAFQEISVSLMMQAPSDRENVGNETVNQFTVRSQKAADKENDPACMLTPAPTSVELLDNVGKITIQSVDLTQETGVDENGEPKYAPLSGMRIQVYDPSGTPLYDQEGMLTNSLGQVKITNVQQGEYSWEELAAPDGYQRIRGKYRFQIDGTKETLQIGHHEIPGRITFTLTDADDENNTPVAGASWNLFKENGEQVFANGNRVYKADGTTGDFITDAAGKIMITGLPWGRYYFQEKEAAKGFEKNSGKKWFQIGIDQYDINSNTVHEELKAKNKEQTTTITLKVKDAQNADAIENAEISVYKVNTESSDTLLESGLKTDGNGTVTVENLKFGSYYFVQTDSSDAYEMPADHESRTTNVEVYADTAGEPLAVSLENERVSGNVSLTVSDDAGHLVGDAVYGLYYQAEDADAFSRVGSYTTSNNPDQDDYGKITINDLGWGDYYFVEEGSPLGYELSKDHILFHVGQDNVPDTIKLQAVMERLTGTVRIIKTDKTDVTKTLSGAVFSLCRTDGTVCVAGKDYQLPDGATAIETDSNGTITISGLKQGGYFLVETKAPENYTLSSEMLRFSITKENATVIQELTSESETGKAVITVKKQVNEVYDPFGLPTFIFKVTKDTGEIYRKSVTMAKDSKEASADFVVDKGHTYTVEEENTSRYYLNTVIVGDNATVLDNGARADLTNADAADAEVTFKNEISQYEKFSHVSSAVNIIKISTKLTGISVNYEGADPLTREDPSYDASSGTYAISKSDLNVTAFYDDGTKKKLTADEYELSPETVDGNSESYTGTVSYTEEGVTKKASFQITVQVP